MHQDEKIRAREICDELLKQPDLHPYFRMKCNLQFGGIADIPPEAERLLKEAQQHCEQLLEISKDDERDEILTYRNIITESLVDLNPEMIEWKLAEGIYITSSEEDDQE